MLPRALNRLRCPSCLGTLWVASKLETRSVGIDAAAIEPACACTRHAQDGSAAPCPECWREEIELGTLACDCGLMYPIVRGVPRVDAYALFRFRDDFLRHRDALSKDERRAFDEARSDPQDARFGSTRRSFSLEWDLWQPGDKTWIWNLEERKRVFARDVDLGSLDRSTPKVVLDAGCGNGQLAAGIASLGFEVYAIDLSSGIERAHAVKKEIAAARAPMLHYVQGNLATPPFAPGSFDIVYSSGVLHHTPDTEATFLKVLALTRPGGRGYVWLYSASLKPVKWALSTTLRTMTTRLPPDVLQSMCERAAPALVDVTSLLTRLGVRHTPPRSAREMAVSLFDELSPRYQHHHRPPEVEAWYRSLGFTCMAVCSVNRNGFGMRATRAAS